MTDSAALWPGGDRGGERQVHELRAVQPRYIYQQVAQELERFITANHLQQGDLLPSERDLCLRLNTSRPTLREAVRTLELVGLVEIRRGGRMAVGRDSQGPIGARLKEKRAGTAEGAIAAVGSPGSVSDTTFQIRSACRGRSPGPSPRRTSRMEGGCAAAPGERPERTLTAACAASRAPRDRRSCGSTASPTS